MNEPTGGYMVSPGMDEAIREHIRHSSAWIPVSVETLVDAGHWDDLTPEQQAKYMIREAELKAWRRSWTGRTYGLRLAIERWRERIGFAIAGYTPREDDY